ncbi:hypothetical protein [Streptomyces sp. NPDC058665]|uniref:hypothetical protein n=1 Tax=Streptomyces sp. NPDC058665 TaxID=3346586 RepID=UPI00365B4840
MTVNKVLRGTAIGASALALAFFSSPALAQAAPADTKAPAGALAKLSHATAAAQLGNAGIGIRSSGGCSDRNNPTCTSLDQVNSATIQGAITLKGATGCAMTVTGGTETGHASGTYSHWNGYKLDFAMSSCLTNYITGTFTSIGGSKWQSASGNIYYNEVNHWDVTYHNCGGC